MTDQVITPEMAVTLHAEGVRRRELPAWIVFQEEPDYPGKVIARFETDTPTPPMLVADTLIELRAKLPPGLRRTKRHSADPPEILEMWSEPTLLHGSGRGRLRCPNPGYVRRTYSGRPRSNMRFSARTATAISVARRASVRERSVSPITRLYRLMSASTSARWL